VKSKIIGIAWALVIALGIGMSSAVFAEELRPLGGLGASDNAAPIYPVIEGVKLERAYRQQPPLVPHPVDKYEIDLKVNQCLRCHEWPYSDQERAPKISDNHYLNRDGLRQDTITGNRYFCRQCHVAQVDAKPLVANRFLPATINR